MMSRALMFPSVFTVLVIGLCEMWAIHGTASSNSRKGAGVKFMILKAVL